MRQLSDAIETFSQAAERLDAAVLQAERRSAAQMEGAEAQGDMILRMRSEIETLKKRLGESAAPSRRAPDRERDREDERIEPYWAAG